MVEARFQNMFTFLRKNNYEDLGNINNDMMCSICSGILINAHSSTSCGCKYCLDCINNHLNEENRFCPGNIYECRLEALDIGSNIHPDHAMNYRISKLVMGCRYSCGFRCELKNMDEHERKCGRHPISCPYVVVGCTETELVNDKINDHLMGESESHATLLVMCIERLQGNIFSMRKNEDELRSDMTNLRNENQLVREENSYLKAEAEHQRLCLSGMMLLFICGSAIVAITARVGMQSRDIEHLDKKCSRIEEKLGEFKRQELGRNITVLRKEQTSGHEVLEKRMRAMEEIVRLQYRKEFVFGIDNWDAKSRYATDRGNVELFSDVFYSHENGYKMRVSVWPNGNGNSTAVYLAVFFYILRGPFDNILSWPFTSTVTLSIIDQNTGIDYANHTFEGDQNDSSRMKPTTDMNPEIYIDELVELDTIWNRPGLCQDNTIFIRCVVKSVTNQR